MPRTELDDRVRRSPTRPAPDAAGAKAVDVGRDSAGRVRDVLLADGRRVGCRWLIVADGARSTLGRVLGRQWHQQTVYGVAARAHLRSPGVGALDLLDLELRSTDGQGAARLRLDLPARQR